MACCNIVSMQQSVRPGTGDWSVWPFPLHEIYAAAEDWKRLLQGVDKPWLCWNISPRWCVVQQNLVKSVGWTPVVGFDPRVGPPPLIDGAVLIDFNQRFGFDEMWMHFPLEWIFLYADRLAFWHSDLLCRPAVMERLAGTFERLVDGQISAVKERKGVRHLFSFRQRRYWELAGCTTREASRSQFQCGAGWWRRFDLHPNCRDAAERARRAKYYYDHGVSIMYWKRHYGGSVVELDPRVLEEGHCTAIGNKKWIQVSAERTTSDKIAELDMNYNLDDVVRHLGIAEFVP